MDSFFENFYKKVGKKFASSQKSRTFASAKRECFRMQYGIGVWCNGNTADSGPAFPGSSPGTPTESFQNTEALFCIYEAW